MKWSAHKSFTDKQTGFLGAIDITLAQRSQLLTYRKEIRAAIRDTFDLLRKSFFNLNGRLTFERSHIAQKFKGQQDMLDELADLLEKIEQLPIVYKKELSNLKPRFWTQGSFRYETLNSPAWLPPQQIDLDDGVYLPLDFLQQKPIIGKKIFISLIDLTLQMMCKQKSEWKFKVKDTCARVLIGNDQHIDVPMYAIPKDQYLQKEEAFDSYSFAALSTNSLRLIESKGSKLLIDDAVYLAVRNSEHWRKSDPADVNEWFLQAVQDNGEVLRRVSRYLKSWRDFIFDTGGPSSITLMKCAVDTFDASSSLPFCIDDSKALRECCIALPEQLKLGVDSPDDLDEDKLFPNQHMTLQEKQDIIDKAIEFKIIVLKALDASQSKSECKNLLASVFGHRFSACESFIIPIAATIVRSTPAKVQPEPKSTNMKSG